MMDEGLSELLSIVEHIFGEIKHDGKPYIIRSYFNIAVVDVGIKKCLEKSTLGLVAEVAVLLVGINSLYQIFLPEMLAIDRRTIIQLSWL